MNALHEIGLRQAVRFFFASIYLAAFNLLIFPPLRRWALVLVGATIGADVVIHNIRFFNVYRTGFPGFQLGDRCFIGDDCLIDLADSVILASDVTLAERVTVLTHMNVGYKNHPLQKYFPSSRSPVRIERGAFVGANATILPGVTIGECAFVAAGSVVTRDVSAWTLAAGVPAHAIQDVRTRDPIP